jgi:hypothetical protein
MLNNPTISTGPLNFLNIRQPWLRAAAKSHLAYSLTIYAEGTCRTRLQSLVCFSEFLAADKPHATARSITRPLLFGAARRNEEGYRPPVRASAAQ